LVEAVAQNPRQFDWRGFRPSGAEPKHDLAEQLAFLRRDQIHVVEQLLRHGTTVLVDKLDGKSSKPSIDRHGHSARRRLPHRVMICTSRKRNRTNVDNKFLSRRTDQHKASRREHGEKQDGQHRCGRTTPAGTRQTNLGLKRSHDGKIYRHPIQHCTLPNIKICSTSIAACCRWDDH